MNRDHSKDQPKTAADFLADLRRDPGYSAREGLRTAQVQASSDEYASAAAPILVELKDAGFPVSTVGELRQFGVGYREAIPVLLRWLPLVSYVPLKEDIVRSLSVPWAKPTAAPALIKEFVRSTDSEADGLRWSIANALEIVADNSVLEELIRLVRDPRYGKAREMLALALANMASPEVCLVLRNLLTDEDVVGHAVMALGRTCDPLALPDLEKLRKHPRRWVREEAEKALSRIRSSLT